MNNEWKLTEKQFGWLVDVVGNNKQYNDLPFSIRKRAMELLKRYGYKGWYDIDGKMSLILLTEMVRESKQQREDDLPF